MSLILRTETVLWGYYTHTMLYFDLITAGLPESHPGKSRSRGEFGGGGYISPGPPRAHPLLPQGSCRCQPALGTERGRRDQWRLSLLSDLRPGEGGQKGFWFGSQLQLGAAEDAGSHSACDTLLQLTLNESFSREGSSLPSSSPV